MQNLLPRSALIALHKAFASSPQCVVSPEIRLFSVQCFSSYYWSNTRFIKGETITGTNFESLKHRRKYKKLCSFYNIFKNKRPTWNPFYSNRNHSNIPPFKTVHNLFKKPFFPSTIIEYTNPDFNLRSSDTYGTFKNTILKFIRPSPISVFKCHNPPRFKFLKQDSVFMNINSSIIFKLCIIQCLSAVLKLDQLLISYSTVPFTTILRSSRNIDCKSL